MLLIKNDPKYNEQWPRALVPYKRIYGVDEPKRLAAPRQRRQAVEAPARRDAVRPGRHVQPLQARSVPARRRCQRGSVTAVGDPDAAFSYSMSSPFNWSGQGADAGLYDERRHPRRPHPGDGADDAAGRAGGSTTTPGSGSASWARSRCASSAPTASSRLDPDGNPDTSFLAKIPADVAFTFQTLDKDGMVLNMAQTWHQVRPGEVRNDCGGCHAHSQKPTDFKRTAAARPDYPVFDLTKQTPLLTTKHKDESKRKWDAADATGLRFEKGVKNVEYHRDVKPILQRSCVACHSGKLDAPAGETRPGRRQAGGRAALGPRQRRTAACDVQHAGRQLHRGDEIRSRVPGPPQPPRLEGVRQAARRFPRETRKGQGRHPQADSRAGRFQGGHHAPAGSGQGGQGRALTDEDRRTLVRWIDLGCPIDKTFDPKRPEDRGSGWLFDDQRPTLTLRHPRPGANTKLARILVGMHDYGTGLDLASFTVTADFAIPGVKRGENLAPKFEPAGDGVWQWTLPRPIERSIPAS